MLIAATTWPLQVVDLIKEYNALGRNSIAIMLDTKGPEVRSGDLSAPIDLLPGAQHWWCPTVRRLCSPTPGRQVCYLLTSDVTAM